jgi:hypothetical protein
MSVTKSWAWVGNGTFPGFSPGANNIAGAQANGLKLDPSAYKEIAWADGDRNGVISDNDRGDGSGAGQDRVMINGQSKVVQDVIAFDNSTMVLNGAVKTVQMGVWVFTDGSYMVRLHDADIPEGAHFSQVSGLTLGKWNGTEYSGSVISTKDEEFICFAAGTLIHTATGQRPVEALTTDDRVMTSDHGFQPIRWVGRRTVAGTGRMAPVRFAEGALGNARALTVSPQHRMLLSGWRAELLFGQSEVLVPALALVNDSTVRRVPMPQVTYVHFMCDQHEVVFAEGIRTESLHPGAQALTMLDAAARAEVMDIFPELAQGVARPTARMVVPAWTGRLLG